MNIRVTPPARPLIWTDSEILDVLDRHARGQSTAQIALIKGTSRAAVLGVLHRVKTAQEAAAPLSDADTLAMLRGAVAGEAFEDLAERFARPRLALLGVMHMVQTQFDRGQA